MSFVHLSSTVRDVVKRTIYTVISTNPLQDEAKIRRVIAEAKVVSFDVFDTLLRRDVLRPQDIFRSTQWIYEHNYGPLSIDFLAARIEAEKEAYTAANGREVSLDDIYQRIDMGGQAHDAARERLRGLEQRVELELSVANTSVKPLYDYAISLGKRIVLTSDMYLPKELIQQMLEKAGYINHERLFLSSEIGLRKYNGELYRYVARELGVSAHDIVHIGDSIQTDWLQARRFNVRSVLIPRDPYNSRHQMRFSDEESTLTQSVFSAVARNMAAGKHYYYRLGVEALGPLLIGLSRFVGEGISRSDATSSTIPSSQNPTSSSVIVAPERKGNEGHIFFTARDGYVLKQAFELLYPDRAKKSHYLYASRRLMGIPSIYSVDDLREVAPTTRLIAVTDLLKAVGVDEGRAVELAREAGYAPDTLITKAESIGETRFNRLCELAFAEVQVNAAQQRELLEDYLRQEGVKPGDAIFDLGWAGNVQGFLNRILSHEDNQSQELAPTKRCGVFGFYLGMDKKRVRPDIAYSSYLGFTHPSLFLGLVELCFSAHEGTALSLVRTDDDAVEVVRADYEYQGLPEATYVDEIQRGALDYVRRCHELEHLAEIAISPQTSFSVLHAVGSNPNGEDLAALSDFRFEDNGVYSKLAHPASLTVYLVHPDRLKADFAASRWKVAFAKKLLKLPLPYYRILEALKKRH